MRPRTPLRAVLTALLTAFAAFGIATAGATTARATTVQAASMPTHVFAPYFEAWTGDDPATLSQQSGAKYLTMAFIQAATKGSCTPYWNGDTSMPIASSSFGASISSIRSAGGDVIPSFGGYGADNTGTEIADSCTDVNQIATAYENVITTYGITRIDLDTEDNSLTDSAGIDRRNKAVKQVESWAASTGRTVRFSYTLPTTTGGLASSGLAVLQNAVSNGARVDVVNIMTFDYYDNASHEMATDTQTAATGLHNQLAGLYPGKSSAALWNMVGVTEMIGIDDFGPAETFTTGDAATVENWAVNTGINTLSFWALQRDNGGCPGTKGAGNCSGISQSTWFFSHAFAPFTGGGTPANDFSVSVSPGSAAVNPGGSTTASVGTAVTSGSAQTVALSTSGAPSGVTASLNPASVTAGGSSTLKVTASSTVPAGSYPITVTGRAPSGTHTATFTLNVNGSGGGGSLVNAGFESGGLAPWTCQPGGTVVGSPVHSGTHALLVTPTSNQTGECDQQVTLQPNHGYTLTAWVQGSYAYVGVSGGATASTWVSSSSWSKLTVPFSTGSSGTVTVYVHGWYAQSNVDADDFALS